MTAGVLLSSAIASLAESGAETPRLDAELLLSCVLQTTRSILLAHHDGTVNAKDCAAFAEKVQRRAAGESVAVITGHKEFRYLDFIVTGDTLVPRPETETLVEAALEKAALKAKTAGSVSLLDLGTGSGAVGLAIKYEAPKTLVTLSDISEAALAVARQNSEKHRLPVALVLSCLFAHIDRTFDIIVSNPPYIPSDEIAALKKEARNEPRLALDGGKDGIELIRQIILESPAYLNRGGYLLLEADPRQMCPIKQLLQDHRYRRITILKDLSGTPRIITATCRGGGATAGGRAGAA
ncbi:MAG: peptide chain release factor N(5)-glutamine methyltransferase [Spirochaetaceae bacterium]|jgi:release factor glutamine methyltransferase|nr:peptide chain release factor N(5)-glutamine methyltransferase [Spirochaetaceae bacterium]